MYSSLRNFGNLSKHIPSAFDIAIVGGGTAGMNIAWKLGRYYKKLNIALIEPSLLRYNYLVVCTGIELDFQRIKGIDEAFQKDNVCSNYSPDTVQKTWKCLQNMESGNAIFTFPNTPIKCAGAPQKIMYLAEDYWRKYGMIHVTPSQKPSEILKPIGDQAGFVDIDKHTLQHVKYPNIHTRDKYRGLILSWHQITVGLLFSLVSMSKQQN